MRATVILFWVRVPALSEQLVEVDPRASNFVTIQFFDAILLAVRSGKSGQKTLWDFAENDTNQEDVGIEPVVTKDVGDSSDEVDNISGRQLGTPERAASEASWLTSLFKTGTTDSPV